jgi:hypothetical protein
MGGCFFVFVARDGRRISCDTGNAVDLIDLPNGVAPDDIVDIRPHQRVPDGDRARSAEYAWSLYSERS